MQSNLKGPHPSNCWFHDVLNWLNRLVSQYFFFCSAWFKGKDRVQKGWVGRNLIGFLLRCRRQSWWLFTSLTCFLSSSVAWFFILPVPSLHCSEAETWGNLWFCLAVQSGDTLLPNSPLEELSWNQALGPHTGQGKAQQPPPPNLGFCCHLVANIGVTNFKVVYQEGS